MNTGIVVLADENIPAVEDFLGTSAQVRRANGRHLSAEHLHGVDALLVRSVTRVNENLLHGSSIRFVGSATSGVDHIDRHYLASAGIDFAYAPGSNANSVVEYVLAAVAACGDQLERLLDGGTVGIVGFGYVGKALVRRLQRLGIDFMVFDPWLDQGEIPNAADLLEVIACGVVSLHCELTGELPWPSYHLLGQRELLYMRPDCLLVNASRGAVIDNEALLRLKADGRGPRVVLDVWEGEPDINSALLQEVLLGTAHIAGYSLDGKVLATRMLCASLAQVLQLDLPDVANPLPPGAAIELLTTTNRADMVRALVQSSYDILRDDALLRGALIGASHLEARESFDLLRRNYCERRELSGSRVQCAELPQSEAELITALGCVLAAEIVR